MDDHHPSRRTFERWFAPLLLALAAWLATSSAAAQDGGRSCGDGVCSAGETCTSCPTDCGLCPPPDAGVRCGDGVCNAGETCTSCPVDCGLCPPPDAGVRCGDGVCSAGETCTSCPTDCGLCPPPDAGVRCGDGVCNAGETCVACPTDCGLCPPPDAGVRCGDGVCSRGETCVTCPTDCGLCPPPDAGGGPRCGDGLCERGESCSDCAVDCNVCRVCGDGRCLGGEACESCPIDCGRCVLPDAGVFDGGAPDAAVDVVQPDVAVDAGFDAQPLADVIVGDGACTLAPTIGGAAPGAVAWTLAPAEAAVTGVRAEATVTFRASGAVDGGACAETLTATGEGTLCGTVLGQRECAALGVTGAAECALPLVCDQAPTASCDDARACCARPSRAAATATRSWSRDGAFGVIACRFDLAGAVTATLDATTRAGGGCAPCADASELDGRASLDASGTATCTVTALGYELQVTPRVTACGVATLRGASGCGAAATAGGGAALTVSVPTLEFGWFSVGAFHRRWEAGDGC